MGSRNSSYSELDTLGHAANGQVDYRNLYENGHSDSECINDASGKKRKVSRPRSESCFDQMALHRQMSWQMPPWIQSYPPKVLKQRNSKVEMDLSKACHRACHFQFSVFSRGQLKCVSSDNRSTIAPSTLARARVVQCAVRRAIRPFESVVSRAPVSCGSIWPPRRTRFVITPSIKCAKSKQK